jgi:putative pyruvate formate lyase activating enzyme
MSLAITLSEPAHPVIPPQGRRGSGRAELARERARLARESLSACQLCHQLCLVNRLAGEVGVCGADADTHVFSAQLEVGDESVLVPTYAIALNGCNMRCGFCISRKDSWNANAGTFTTPLALAQQAQKALDQGARTVQFLGGEPVIHLPFVLSVVAQLPDSAQLVFKTNATASAQARELMDGLFDFHVADYKFGQDDCAIRLAHAHQYTASVQENLLWACGQGGLIIRHLLMPGHVECCWKPVAAWIAEHVPSARISLRTGFWPDMRTHALPDLRRTLTSTEINHARELARFYQLNLIP